MKPEVWPPLPWAQVSRGNAVCVGDTIYVRTGDYRTGRGPLLLRVTRLGETQVERDGVWRHLYGVQLRVDGEAIKERWVLVRLKAPHGRRPPFQRSSTASPGQGVRFS